MRANELAELMGKSTPTIRNMARKGIIPATIYKVEKYEHIEFTDAHLEEIKTKFDLQ